MLRNSRSKPVPLRLIEIAGTMTDGQLRYGIGLRLRGAMADAHLNREQVSLLTGFGEERIEQWEQGVAEMYFGELEVLCEVLDVDSEFMLGWDRLPPN